MSLPEDGKAVGALKREWAAARIVVIGGFVVAIAVAGYFVYRARQEYAPSAKFTTWMFRIATNLALNAKRDGRSIATYHGDNQSGRAGVG